MSASKTHRIRNLAVLAALLVIITLIFGFRFRQLGVDEVLPSIRSVQDAEGVPVETVEVALSDLSTWTTLAGTVEGTVQYPIVSNNALSVIEICVSEGDRVEAGDVIIRLSSGAPSPMFHSLDKSTANYRNAELDVKRLRNLFEAGAVSQSALDAAETRLKVLAADLQDAEGSSTLVASSAGRVSSVLVNVGDTVKGGSALAWITDTSEVNVVFSAGSRQALDLEVGQLALWSSPDNRQKAGVISQIDLMANPKTHLLEGTARFPNADGRLIPGLLISFKVRTANRSETLVLPRACIVDSDEGRSVWLVDGVATRAAVEVGIRTQENVEILDGLRQGQTVVQYGQSLLSEGAMIKVIATGEGR